MRMKRLPGRRRPYLRFFKTKVGQLYFRTVARLSGRRPTKEFASRLADTLHETLWSPTWWIRSAGVAVLVVSAGTVLVVPFLLLLLTGRVRIHGHRNLLRNVRGGRKILAFNHPSLLEPLFIPFLLEPLLHMRPTMYMPWSVPDWRTYKIVPWWLRWIYKVTRCVEIDRESKDYEGYALVYDAVGNCDNILVLHPEEGRTSSRPEEILPLQPRGRELRRTKPRPVPLFRRVSLRTRRSSCAAVRSGPASGGHPFTSTSGNASIPLNCGNRDIRLMTSIDISSVQFCTQDSKMRSNKGVQLQT